MHVPCLSSYTHDGHDFVDEAFARGAVAAVVERRWGEQREDGPWRQRPLLLVEDTLQAFGDLARGYREQFDIPIVAIVGSAGKTTTKEMTAVPLPMATKLGPYFRRQPWDIRPTLTDL